MHGEIYLASLFKMTILPESVVNVSKDELEAFANGKRVGSYLLGRTIGQGSFAKVKEAIHVSTGEKVSEYQIECNLENFMLSFPIST